MTIAGRTHLFPSRTQKLSSLAPMILGGKLPGKVGRCRFFLFLFYDHDLKDREKNRAQPHLAVFIRQLTVTVVCTAVAVLVFYPVM